MKKYAGRKFTIVGVNSDDSLETLRKAMKREKLRFPSFFDGGGTGGPIATRWGVTGWPTVYILDHKGIIRAKSAGFQNFDPLIERLVKEAETELAAQD